MDGPEQLARKEIDRLLTAAGWVVQSKDQYNPLLAAVALCEVQMSSGPVDYLLLVDGKALGVVEAKAAGITLTGVEAQSARYAGSLPAHIQAWRPGEPLPFRYESTGIRTRFTNTLDPDPRSRRVFAFHQPETLRQWAHEATTLRLRLQQMPPLIADALWKPQITAIHNLERSLAEYRPRALVQMTMGSGKTFTTVNEVYRLVRYAGAKRVLFLVDRINLGEQALNEFQTFTTPDDGRKFTELYNVQLLRSNHIDTVSKVVITTIQRLYSIMTGDSGFEAEDESVSWQEEEEKGRSIPTPPRSVQYTADVPIELFDFIVIDECHRSIYSVWGQVLEYFDAFLIGLTATPSKLTLGFFRQNMVMEYGHLDAVADGINVPGEVYHIRTRVSEDGSTIEAAEAGYYLPTLDRQTGERRYALMDEDFAYAAAQLDRGVQTPAQIRAVVREFRDRLKTDLFPGRNEVPKTLVFAKDDLHAETIVKIIREEFARGNDFCQKITYRVTEGTPKEILAAFRNSYNPRIAVTVDMVATGTDIKAIEILLFMRLVKSPNYLMQMKGRGTRVVSQDELQRVSGKDAVFKDRFVIVDAVGVTELESVETLPTLNRKRSTPLPRLMERLVHNARGPFDADTIATVADRLARMQRKLHQADRDAVREASGGASLSELTHALIDALDLDAQIAQAQATAAEHGAPADAEPTEAEIEAAAQALMKQAVYPLLTQPALRTLLLKLYERTELVLDEISGDEVTHSDWDGDPNAAAQQTVQSFRAFIEQNKDELDALQIIFEQPYSERQLTFAMVRQLAEALAQPPYHWTTEQLWEAYERLERDRVRGVGAPRVLSDIVALVRHTLRPDDAPLDSYPALVQQRYEAWLEAQAAEGRSFTPKQRWWLDHIAQHIGINLEIRPEHLEIGEFFNRGGRGAAQRDLGTDWQSLLNELNSTLVVT